MAHRVWGKMTHRLVTVLSKSTVDWSAKTPYKSESFPNEPEKFPLLYSSLSPPLALKLSRGADAINALAIHP